MALGHNPRVGFFFVDQLLDSLPTLKPTLLDCETLDTVAVDMVDDIDEEELDRWTLFRGINIRDTSSVFMELSTDWPPLSAAYHPSRGPDCTLGGVATAVMRRRDGYNPDGSQLIFSAGMRLLRERNRIETISGGKRMYCPRNSQFPFSP